MGIYAAMTLSSGVSLYDFFIDKDIRMKNYLFVSVTLSSVAESLIFPAGKR